MRACIHLVLTKHLPLPAGVSLAANAVFDHLLGDCLSSLSSGIPGLLLVFAGVTLCTLAQQEQHPEQQQQLGQAHQA